MSVQAKGFDKQFVTGRTPLLATRSYNGLCQREPQEGASDEEGDNNATGRPARHATNKWMTGNEQLC